MKTAIHPKWYPEATVVCGCGRSFVVGSTKDDIHIEVCNQCHPFFTGEARFVDTMGRVEKFQKKQKFAAKKQASKKKKRIQEEQKDNRPKTLREMLLEYKKQ